MKNILKALFCIGAMSATHAQNTTYYQQFADYKMEIDVDAKNYSYKGKQQVKYKNNSPDTLSVAYFHLYWNAFKPNSMMDQNVQNNGKEGDKRLQKNGISRLASIPKKEEGAQNIKFIKQDGKNLTFEVQETILKVNLAKPILPNSSTTFEMEWDAVIPMQIRRAGRNNAEGVEMTMTQWYPKIAEYDYDGWATFDYLGREFHAPFANFDVKINIDKNYIIGAGGTLVNRKHMPGYNTKSTAKPDAKGKISWHWKAENMLDFAWAADPDFTVETAQVPDGPELFFVYQKTDKTQYWEPAKKYTVGFFELMNRQFGKYVYPSYAFVQGGDGGMEYGMCTMILGEAKSLERLVGLMFHEAAHSWYQQMLATNESMKPWLDEGFTSYAESLAMYELFDEKKTAPHPFTSTIENYVKFTKTGREVPAVYLADHHKDGTAYSFASYVKGELFLVQLGYILGEDQLSKLIKTYYNTWKLKHPNNRDFMHLAQKISGMDLKWFEHYWINTTKTIDYAVGYMDEKGKKSQIQLYNQGEVPMPIDLTVTLKNGQKKHYHIPTNLTRVWKSKDRFGAFETVSYWPFTQKEYRLELPFAKSEIASVEIDESKRLADVNRDNNVLNN